jgi:hypothetical protein
LKAVRVGGRNESAALPSTQLPGMDAQDAQHVLTAIWGHNAARLS